MPYLIFLLSCINNKSERTTSRTITVDSLSSPSHNDVPKPPDNHSATDASNKNVGNNNSEEVLKFITDFSEKEFRDIRRNIIAEGAEHQYQISDVTENDGILKYDFVVSGIDGKGVHTCNLQKGETTFNWVGDKDIAQMFFQQAKVNLRDADCNKTKVAEQCKAYDEMKGYPVKTRVTISLLNQGDVSICTISRQIIPKKSIN